MLQNAISDQALHCLPFIQQLLFRKQLIKETSFFQIITLVLLNPDIPTLATSVDSDQLASEEAN